MKNFFKYEKRKIKTLKIHAHYKMKCINNFQHAIHQIGFVSICENTKHEGKGFRCIADNAFDNSYINEALHTHHILKWQ
jgi:hypothetical protein